MLIDGPNSNIESPEYRLMP